MKKNLFLLIFTIYSCMALPQVEADNNQYKIIKIDYLDDGKPIVYVEKDSIIGIIIEDKKKINVDVPITIEVGKSYSLNLTPINRKYRGRNDEFRLQSTNGTEKTIWTSNDGYPLILFKANNLSGLLFEE